MKNQNFFNQRKQETDIIGRLAGLNFTQVELLDIPMDIKVEIVEACEDFIKDFPILKEIGIKLKAVNILEIGKTTFAESNISLIDNKLVGIIYLNYDEFMDAMFLQKLAEKKKKGMYAGNGVRGVIIHELTHLLHYLLDIIYLRLNFMDSRSTYQLNLLSNRLVTKYTTESIQFQVLRQCKLSKNSIIDNLSMYATADANEFVAEALSEYYTTTTPGNISQKVYKTMRCLYYHKSLIRLNLLIFFFIYNIMKLTTYNDWS